MPIYINMIEGDFSGILKHQKAACHQALNWLAGNN